jgi:hypothetical protein
VPRRPLTELLTVPTLWSEPPEETNNRDRNYDKVEKWTKDGANLERARKLFVEAIKH